MALGAFKKETAETILAVVRYLKESGYVIERPGRGQQFIPPQAPVYVRNESGEEIPAFACLQTTGTVDAGGQNYVKVDKPVDDTGTAGKYLFNGIAPIEIGGYGIAHDGPLVRMLTDGTAVTCGDLWQPTIAAWTVNPGGELFTAAGADDIGTNVMRAFISSGGGSSQDHFLFTLSEDMGTTDADAEIRSMDDATQIDASADVKNTLSDFSHLKSGDRGICVKVDGVYYAVHPEGAGQSGGVVFNLTSNLAASVGSTATATVIVSGVDGVPAPSSITVYNTGKKKSWTGALGWAVLIGNQFWVAEVDQYPIRSVVVLSADTHTFSPGATYQGRVDTQKATPVSVSSMVATTTYPFAFIPSPLPAITNPLNLIGLSGDKGLVTYNEDADEFQLAEIYPQEKRRVAFKLTGNMPNVTVASTIAYAPTEPREFTSGEMPHLPSPPTDPIYDPLKLIVDGRIDDQGVIEYSYRAGQWHVTAFRRREFGSIQFQIMTVITKSGGPFAGLKAATGRVKLCHPDRASLLDTVVEIIDHSGCVFDLPEEDLIDVWAWATERIKTDGGGATTIHWAADDRCCTPADGGGGGGGGGGDIDGGAP